MMKRILPEDGQRNPRGQALVETALILVFLLMLVGSIVEFALLLNTYMSLQDAARNAARFSSDGMYDYRDNKPDCFDDPSTPTNEATQDFYRQTACLVNMELSQSRPQVTLVFTSTIDDIVVSAFSIAGSDMVITPTVWERYPTNYGEDGWSAALDWIGRRNQVSKLSRTQIASKLDRQAPSTGFVLVEVFGHYDQKLKLPWMTAILPDPFNLYTYALMPLVSAEPDIP